MHVFCALRADFVIGKTNLIFIYLYIWMSNIVQNYS